MSTLRFEALKFSEESLWGALSNRHVSPAEVRTHDRARYIYRYLVNLKAETIVVETDYIDGDYLDDFASYYVKCFTDYNRKCKRLHFFKCSFLDDEDFLRKIHGHSNNEEESNLEINYLGFVVARPLPQAIVGRTILRTYESDNGRRNYACTRSYKANLFGLELTIPSLAFQEQDTVLAACATVSLWSCFQKTAELFGKSTPTPAAITRVATQAAHDGRPIPSHGLMTYEICAAIRHVELEPEVFTVRDSLPVVSLIYAYLRMGIPVILGVEIEGVGGHAITLTGYSISGQRKRPQEVAGSSTGINPQSADSGGVLGNLGESARELILKRLSSREWACHYGWSKRQAATSGCAVRRMKTLRADFRKGGCKNPLITMTLGAGGFK